MPDYNTVAARRADRWFGRVGIARTHPVRNMDHAARNLADLATRLGYRPVEANS